MQYNLEHGQVTFCSFHDYLELRNGTLVKLRHLEKLLLQALLSKITDKREIIQYIWPKTVVSDGSYHKLVFDLRKQLNLAGIDPTLIKTIPRRGLAYSGHWQEIIVSEKTETLPTASDTASNMLSPTQEIEISNSSTHIDAAASKQTGRETQPINNDKKIMGSTKSLLLNKISRINPSLSLTYCVCGTIGLVSSLVLAVAF